MPTTDLRYRPRCAATGVYYYTRFPPVSLKVATERPLLNRVVWMQNAPISSQDVLFRRRVPDVSVWEMFWGMYGASVVLLPSGLKRSANLARLISVTAYRLYAVLRC